MMLIQFKLVSKQLFIPRETVTQFKVQRLKHTVSGFLARRVKPVQNLEYTVGLPVKELPALKPASIATGSQVAMPQVSTASLPEQAR